MKTSKKIIIIIIVVLLLAMLCLAIMLGASRDVQLKVDYMGSTKEYVISRNYLNYILNKIYYHGSMERELMSRVKDGDYASGLMEISKDFSNVISDMNNGVESKVDSNVEFNAMAKERFVYHVGKAGKRLNSESCITIAKAIDEDVVATNIYDIDDVESLEEMKNRTSLLASYTTEYASSGRARRQNIKVATSYINGTIVESGDKFSFNEVVGERTTERGFEEAKVIVGGKYVKGVGGGVCQVSTTLYNAWVLSGNDVIYASSHSLPPHYVDLSRDAMVSSYNDMILVNNGQTPLYVCGYLGNDSVTFEVYGKSDGYRYDIVSELTGEREPSTEYVGEVGEDDEWEEIIISYGVPSYESRAYLVRYDNNGDEVSRTIIREDSYKCQPRMINRVKK